MKVGADLSESYHMDTQKVWNILQINKISETNIELSIWLQIWSLHFSVSFMQLRKPYLWTDQMMTVVHLEELSVASSTNIKLA